MCVKATGKRITASRRDGDEWQEVNCRLPATSLEIQFHLGVTCLVFSSEKSRGIKCA